MSATQAGFVRSTLLFLLIGTAILIGIIVAQTAREGHAVEADLALIVEDTK